MRLVRSDSPEVVRSIAMTKALATRKGLLHFACVVNGFALLIALVASLAVSPRASLWIIGPVVLALNAYVLSRAITFRRQWEIAGSANRLYIRLFAWRSKDHADAEVPDVLVLDASEIASMWARTVDVYLYGPKPKFVDWMLMIEPAQGTFEDITKYIRPLLTQLEEKAVYVTSKERRLTIEWGWWQPSLREFLQQVAQECPSTAIGPEHRSELDLNGIWHGNRDFPNPEQRRLLRQALRLGCYCDLLGELGLRRRMPRRKAAALLSEIAREEESETEQLTVQ
jgi:hypothetical protein